MLGNSATGGRSGAGQPSGYCRAARHQHHGASGGIEQVYSGGAASFTTDTGGYENVSSGGSAFSTTVNNGGFETLSTGGSASFTTVNSGGFEVDVRRQSPPRPR